MQGDPDLASTIAFIGLGAMGLPMASNLARKGFALSAYDIDPEKVARLAALGARPAASIAQAVEAADIVITMLPATAHVEAVVLGPQGVLAHIGQNAILMDMSTIDAKATDNLAAACAKQGVGFTDCPVGRLVSHAERGESLFMVGADDAVFSHVEPLLHAMGTTVHRCGAPGMGSRMKVVNNFMLLSTAQVVAEAVALGSKLGLDLETMKTVTGATTANNGQFQIAFATKVLLGDTAPGFTIDLAFKDMSLAMNAAADQRMGLPVGAAAHAVYGAARAGALAGQDYSALLDQACALAGIETPRLPAP
jgi:4-hydroxybutyrate dehydrogenase/sulfolactaldehyde 3-reductase